jgi:DNA glycosylase AlkZ-like
MTVSISKDDVVAFRLNAHHLGERLSADSLLDVAGRCGIQNSPPGSALLALHARVRDLTQERLTEAIEGDKSLLQSWCMRGAPFFFPTTDAPVFTTGVLPPTEAAMRHFIRGVVPAVDKLGMSLGDVVELTGAEIRRVLADRRLAIDALGIETAARIAPRLPTQLREIWEQEGPYATGQPLGEAIVHFCTRILTLQQVVCFAPRAGNTAPFILVDEWLGSPIPDIDPETARAELLRRYLHCYGPSTRADFAAWLGVRAGDAMAWWSLVQHEMTQVECGGTSWILTEDLDALRSAPAPSGVRLLPPRDPYTQLRDRETILDRKHHRHVWKPIGEPGTVLVDGRVAGTWRPRKHGRTLAVTISAFGPIRDRDRKLLNAEAVQVAVLRGASASELEFVDS